MEPDGLQRVQRAGRRIGVTVFASLVSLFVVVCSVQILYQGFHDRSDSVQGECRSNIARLLDAVRHAREAAARHNGGERDSLRRFRAVLDAEWHHRDAVDKLCQGDTWAKDSIAEIDEWRWVEEMAVRFEATDLAPSRRRMHVIEANLKRPFPGE